MRIEHFRYAFKRLNGFYLKEHIILFRKPLELWNEVTGESVTFKTLDEVLEYELAGEKVKGTSYDDAVDKWLKGNAKKYGYKYTKQK